MRDLTKGNVSGLIFRFALPMIIGNVFQQLHQLINTVIVGKYISSDAMAAVGASFPIIFALVAMIIGVGIGGSVVVAQYFGAKQFENVKRTSDTVILFLMISGFILGLLGAFFSREILTFIQTPTDLLDDASLYLSINLLGIFAMFGYTAVSSILRGMGDSVRPLYFLIFSTLLNIALDLLFVLVFDWGIAGVATSTVISYTVSFISVIIYLNKYHTILRYSFKKPIIFDKLIFRQVLRIGIPSGFQQTFVAFGGLALISIVNGFGKEVVAAYTAAGRIDTFISMPAMNFSGALSAFVGQNLALNKLRRIKNGFYSTLLMSGAVCILLTLIVVFWGDSIMKLFVKSTDPSYDIIIETGHRYLVIVCSFYILFSSMFVTNGLLRGAGATLVPMFVTLFSLWLVRLPLAWLFSKTLEMGPTGIWWSIPVGWCIGFAGSFIYYLSGKWKGKSVVEIDSSIEE